MDEGAEYIDDYEPGVDSLSLAPGIQTETLPDGGIRVFKAELAGAFGFGAAAAFGAAADIADDFL